MNKWLITDNYRDKKQYINLVDNTKKEAEDNKASKIDPKRSLTYKQKSIVWDKSKKHYNFDYNLFRVDIIGNLGIKSICYNNNTYNKCFAIEYEHFISHSNNGRTDINNVCILNAGINRSKGQKEIYKHNYEEYHGLKALHGVSPDALLKDLEYTLHDTCKKYNLYFIKINHYWTLEKTENGKYIEYNNEYDSDNWSDTCSECSTYIDSEREIDSDINSETEIDKAKIFAAACITVLIHEGVTYSYKEYIKPMITDNKETTTLDKVITYSTTILLTGIAYYTGLAFLSSKEKEENK